MAYKLLNYDEMYAEKVDIHLEIVATMRGRREDRELQLIAEQTRTACAGEIHEFILTDEPGHGPGATVNRCAYIGFATLRNGGLLAIGDTLTAGEQALGTLVGFDYNHMPNHMNIVFHSPEMQTGEELQLGPGDKLTLSRT